MIKPRKIGPIAATLVVAVVSAFVFSAAVAQAQELEGPFRTTCSYSTGDPVDSGALDVDCSMTLRATVYSYERQFRFGDETVTVSVPRGYAIDRWKPVKINGRPGVQLELWRGSYVVVSNDMWISFEWRDRGAPKYPVN